jgi:hypothetical protein
MEHLPQLEAARRIRADRAPAYEDILLLLPYLKALIHGTPGGPFTLAVGNINHLFLAEGWADLFKRIPPGGPASLWKTSGHCNTDFVNCGSLEQQPPRGFLNKKVGGRTLYPSIAFYTLKPCRLYKGRSLFPDIPPAVPPVSPVTAEAVPQFLQDTKARPEGRIVIWDPARLLTRTFFAVITSGERDPDVWWELASRQVERFADPVRDFFQVCSNKQGVLRLLGPPPLPDAFEHTRFIALVQFESVQRRGDGWEIVDAMIEALEWRDAINNTERLGCQVRLIEVSPLVLSHEQSVPAEPKNGKGEASRKKETPVSQELVERYWRVRERFPSRYTKLDALGRGLANGSSVDSIRSVAEAFTRIACRKFGVSESGLFVTMIENLNARGHIPRHVARCLGLIRLVGNDEQHIGEPVSPDDAVLPVILESLIAVMTWGAEARIADEGESSLTEDQPPQPEPHEGG